jgi:hypothetical protein
MSAVMDSRLADPVSHVPVGTGSSLGAAMPQLHVWNKCQKNIADVIES